MDDLTLYAQELADVTAAEGLRVLKLADHPLLGRLFLKATRPALHRFSLTMAQFDLLVAQEGIMAAAQWLLPRFVNELEIVGQPQIPAEGPLVVAANHPGAADALALMASVPRPDFMLVVGLPAVKALRYAMRHVIFVPPKPRCQHGEVTRAIVEQLRLGRCVLIFPRGNLEPDPAWLEGSDDSINNWSSSLRVFAQEVPDTQIVPAVVGGAFSAQALRHPLLRFYRTHKDRQRAAIVLQNIVKFLRPEWWPVRTRIQFGQTVMAAREGAEEVLPAVKAQVKALLENMRFNEWPLMRGAVGW